MLNEAYERAQKLGPNQVQVWPGGALFTSIGAAIASIQSATPKNQYQVAIGPGTYNESVVLKDNVYMSGAGANLTKLVAGGTSMPSGVLSIGGNCGASMMTINCTGNVDGGYSIALYVVLDAVFQGGGLSLYAMDSNSGSETVATVCGISNIAGSGNFNVRITSSHVGTAAQNYQSNLMGVQLGGPQVVFTASMSEIVALSAGGVALITGGGANAKVSGCNIAGNAYSLLNQDQSSPIVANQCTLSGQVSAGVTVNN